MTEITLPQSPEYPADCPQCTSGQKSYSGSRKKVEVRYACGSVWRADLALIDPERPVWLEATKFACESGDKPVCSNCDGIRCMHFVCREWETIDECDGWCCPTCRPVAYDETLPENWRKEND